MDQENLANIDCNLQLILGDLNTVTRMMEDGQPCTQILHKIGTIQRALWFLGNSLIACQVRESITFLQDNPDPDARAIEISRLQDLYKEMIRTPYLK
jgi:DNA-binding FrmR family transcriptional regulator